MMIPLIVVACVILYLMIVGVVYRALDGQIDGDGRVAAAIVWPIFACIAAGCAVVSFGERIAERVAARRAQKSIPKATARK